MTMIYTAHPPARRVFILPAMLVILAVTMQSPVILYVLISILVADFVSGVGH
jgi:hypothetical protein